MLGCSGKSLGIGKQGIAPLFEAPEGLVVLEERSFGDGVARRYRVGALVTHYFRRAVGAPEAATTTYCVTSDEAADSDVRGRMKIEAAR